MKSFHFVGFLGILLLLLSSRSGSTFWPASQQQWKSFYKEEDTIIYWKHRYIIDNTKKLLYPQTKKGKKKRCRLLTRRDNSFSACQGIVEAWIANWISAPSLLWGFTNLPLHVHVQDTTTASNIAATPTSPLKINVIGLAGLLFLFIKSLFCGSYL